MNKYVKAITAILVLLLLFYAVSTTKRIVEELMAPQSEPVNAEIKKMQSAIDTYKKHREQIYSFTDTSFDINAVPTPFGNKRVIKPTTPKKKTIDFDRKTLTLKGIMEGKKTVVLLKERSGKTHLLSKGEEVHERKIINITKNSVILDDKLGRDTLFVE